MAYAFQCKNCGRLVASADAGEREFPASCPSCGHGVQFDPVTGIKTFEDAENWEALADLDSDARKALAEDHGVAQRDLVEKHEPAASSGARGGANIHLVADEGVGQEDKA